MSFFELSGIPSEFGLLLLTLFLALIVIVIFPGASFGPLKDLLLNKKKKRTTAVVAPVLLVFTLSLYLPFWGGQRAEPPIEITEADDELQDLLSELAASPVNEAELKQRIRAFFASGATVFRIEHGISVQVGDIEVFLSMLNRSRQSAPLILNLEKNKSGKIIQLNYQ